MDGPGTAAHPHRSNRLPLPLTTATGHRQPWPRRLPRRRRQSHYVSDEGLSECQLVTSPAPPALRKHGLLFEVSLCLSRACLGKMFVFKYKWLQTIVFTHRQSLCCVREASTQAAAPASAQRGACVYHHAKQRFTTTQRACAIVVDRKASFRSIKTPLRFAGGFSFCTILARNTQHKRTECGVGSHTAPPRPFGRDSPGAKARRGACGRQSPPSRNPIRKRVSF
jgi:hypothetical protein